jgi:hypothetical protein
MTRLVVVAGFLALTSVLLGAAAAVTTVRRSRPVCSTTWSVWFRRRALSKSERGPRG